MKTAGIFSYLLAAVMALSSAAAAAQNPSPEMSKALSRLASAQQIDKFWPIMLDTLEPAAAQNVQQAAISGLENSPLLSKEQRAAARAEVEKLAPQMAADVTAQLRAIDATKMMQQMMEAVYPKYFTLAEVEGLATYYSSSAYQKTSANDMAKAVDREKTGDAPAVVAARHDAGYTAQEKQAIADFDASPLGQKVRQTAPQVGADTFQFIIAHLASSIDPLIQKYGVELAERIKASTK